MRIARLVGLRGDREGVAQRDGGPSGCSSSRLQEIGDGGFIHARERAQYLGWGEARIDQEAADRRSAQAPSP